MTLNGAMGIINEVLQEIEGAPQTPPELPTPPQPEEEEGEEDRKGNKAQHIREALKILGDAKPVEVVDWLKQERGLDVTATYVSLIKNQFRLKPKQFTPAAYLAAKQLVRVAGSIQQAKAVLDALDIEKETVSDLQERYTTLLEETEQMLNNPGANLTRTDRRDMLAETRRIRKLLNTINEVGTLTGM